MSESLRLGSFHELAAWADDEGLLYDAMLTGAKETPASVELTLAVPVDAAPVDNVHDRLLRVRALHYVFRLTAIGGELGDVSLPALPALFEIAFVDGGESFGFGFRFATEDLRLLATSWQFDEVGNEILESPRVADCSKMTFHGPGPVSIGELITGLEPVADVYANWKGGHSFGSALVAAHAPERPADTARFGGAYRVVPTGATATDPAGVWLTGQSLASGAYVSLIRSPESSGALVSALVNALMGHAGLEWVSSGNRVMDGEALSAWTVRSPGSSRPR